MEEAKVGGEAELPGEAMSGQREELVSADDIKLVAEMTKNELNMYSISRFGTELQLADRLKLLQTKVITMIDERLKKPGETQEESKDNGTSKVITVDPEFIFNPANRRILEWTANLATREDLIPCWLIDKKGKKL